MSDNTRAYSRYAEALSIRLLQDLLSFTGEPLKYRNTMIDIGHFLGDVLNQKIPASSTCLIASTAEDADFLAKGIRDSLERQHPTLAAIFWNNHYAIPGGGSIAPVVHKFIQPGFERADTLVIVKSIISSSCVVRTNLLALIERLQVTKIYVVAPVMHTQAEETLRSEFPLEISNLFDFVYLAQDSERDASGEVKPGIGGQIYQLLGMEDQPARTGFMPELVKQLAEI